MGAAQTRWTSALGLLVAAVILCASRTSTGVFANLAAATTRQDPVCAAQPVSADSSGTKSSVIPPAALVLLVEAAKLLISAVLWRLQLQASRSADPPGLPTGAKSEPLEVPHPTASEQLLDRRFFLFAPSAALYCSCNVLWLIALGRMAAPVFELLSTLRIILSVALAWAFTQSGAALRLHQYASLALLVAANLMAHWGLDVGAAAHPLDTLLVFLSISSSAVANLLFELLTKERFLNVSLHLQNIQLYSWGVLFNSLVFLAMQRSAGLLSLDWLACANLWHGLLVLAFACVGIVTGVVLKYHGNVASVVAQSFAVHLSAFLSRLSIRFQPTSSFMSGAILCQVAILLYNKEALLPKNGGGTGGGA